MSLLRRRFLFVCAALACVFVFSWFVSAESSPLQNYFVWHTAVPNAWGWLNIPPILLGLTLSGDIHNANMVGVVLGMIVQWGVVAFLLSLLVVRPVAKSRQKS